MINVLKSIPREEQKMARRKLVEEDDLLLMQIALKSDQKVPRHKANSRVHLLLLSGSVSVDLDGEEKRLERGDLLPVDYDTMMEIVNAGEEEATFLVMKTPHPTQMGERNKSR